jgi:hypothetical protein
MGFFSGKTKQITTGGNLIRGLKGEGTALRPLVDKAIQAGKTDYEGFGADARIAGFTDPQVAGQQAALGVAGQGVGGLQQMQQNLAGLGQVAAGSYQPLTQQDIAAQRELLAGSEGAQKLAAERGFKEGLMDIGGAAAGSVGGYGGTRADLLRGDALGTYAMGLADIEGGLQTQAYQGALADRGLAAAEADQLAKFYGLEAGAEADVYGRQLGQAQAQMDIGAQQQAQEQARRDFEYQEFIEEQNDPFLKAQKATGAVTDFSTLFTPQETTLQQKKSGFDRVVGGLTAIKGLTEPPPGAPMPLPAATGGTIGRFADGGQLSAALLNRYKAYKKNNPQTVTSLLEEKAAEPQLPQLGPTVERAEAMANPESVVSPLQLPEKTEAVKQKEKELESSQDFAASVLASKQGENITPSEEFDEEKGTTGARLLSRTGGASQSQLKGAGDRRLNYSRGISRAAGGSVYLEDGGILGRVFGGARDIASSIGGGFVERAKQGYENYVNMSPEDSLRYGLAILAEEDRVGDSGGQALARAISGVQAEKRGEDLEKEKLEVARAKAAASERLLRGSTTSDDLLESVFKDRFTPAQVSSPGYGVILQKAKQYARDKSIAAAQKGLIGRTPVERDQLAQDLMIDFAVSALSDPAYMSMLVAGAAGQQSGGVSGPSLPPLPQGLVATTAPTAPSPLAPTPPPQQQPKAVSSTMQQVRGTKVQNLP